MSLSLSNFDRQTDGRTHRQRQRQRHAGMRKAADRRKDGLTEGHRPDGHDAGFDTQAGREMRRNR